MSSVQNLRELINQRLTAAAEEIFTEFEKTIVQYEEEIDRQRRLLDNIWKPQITQYTAELPQHVCKEIEGFTNQQLSNQERNSGLEQENLEPPQIKEEQEELCTSQEGEQLVLNLETDGFMVIPTKEKGDHREPESTGSLLFHSCPTAQSPYQEGGSRWNKRHRRNRSHSSNVDHTTPSESHCNTDTWTKPVTDDVCGNAFKENNQMQKPLRTQAGERSFICQICGRCFRQSCNLIAHMRIHTGEKPYSCKTCRKRFRHSNSLLIHMRTHTGERPYSCTTCGKRFSQSSNLVIHTRTHTGEKPYSCKICAKSFRHSKSLLLHMKTHTVEKL
ncbi:zinc finger protein 771-like [Amphiprion ocellaris]|uniref:zinc finger protein 771-like n=1 Tax=Amphiprion ocellaris TaxID=80972 RepID=UPI00241120F7|nr:zinc finger protein 771-like [Amphiprion ocellaris]